VGSPPPDEYSHELNSVRSPTEHGLIGQWWKRGNTCSRLILTDRGLDHNQIIGGLDNFLFLCSLQGELHPTAFLVRMALWTHSDSIPNSGVKRDCGDDTLGVAPRDNSSAPGRFFNRSLSRNRGAFAIYLEIFL
jgi:hypothetical protein